MNKFILSVCILFSGVSHSQTLKGNYKGADGVPHNLEFQDAGGKIIPIGDRSGIYGSPLFKNAWGFGIIKLKNGIAFSDSAMGYSLYNDKLFFRRNGKIYLINYPAKEFSIEYAADSNENKIYNFQNGFPEIDKNDSLVFYEVLFSGHTISLLKLLNKKILEPYNYGIGGHREYSLFQEYFVFFPKENKMVELGIKASLNVLRKKLPEYSNQIKAFNSTHKLNTKKDDDLIRLFSFLDSGSL